MVLDSLFFKTEMKYITSLHMVNLIPLSKIISTVAILYAAVVGLIVAISWKYFGLTSLSQSFKFAFAGATILNLTLLGIIYFAWKWIWKKLPFLNTVLFPDLNGLWDMRIHWSGVNGSGVVNAKAEIKQNFIRISMEVKSEGSDSETLIAHPKKDSESGRPILYYIYRVIPKHVDTHCSPSYEGSAILKFVNSGNGELEGNYFTSVRTNGHFSLRRNMDLKS